MTGFGDKPGGGFRPIGAQGWAPIVQPHHMQQFKGGYNGPVCPSKNTYQSFVSKLTGGSQAERTEAVHQLSISREQIPDLAIMLWEMPATITSLLADILAIYPHMAATSTASTSAPPPISGPLASRVCSVLTLLQCVAGHDKTRLPFIQANIPMYLFPFLHSTNKSRECEYFKLTSLGVIGSLVKSEDPEIIKYLLQNEFVPLCLRILKFGQELSRLVAAFIVNRILSDQNGLQSVCGTHERLETVIKVLNIVLCDLATAYNPTLAKNVLESYESLLKEHAAVDVVATMDMEKLRQTPLSSKCGEKFCVFVNHLLQMNSGARRP